MTLTITGARIATRHASTTKPAATIATLSFLNLPPEQLQRGKCCDLLTRDETRFLGRVFLVTKQLGGARAHARASGAWVNCLN